MFVWRLEADDTAARFPLSKNQMILVGKDIDVSLTLLPTPDPLTCLFRE